MGKQSQIPREGLYFTFVHRGQQTFIFFCLEYKNQLVVGKEQDKKIQRLPRTPERMDLLPPPQLSRQYLDAAVTVRSQWYSLLGSAFIFLTAAPSSKFSPCSFHSPHLFPKMG